MPVTDPARVDVTGLDDVAREAVLAHRRRGWVPIRVYPDQKRPFGKDWESTQWSSEADIVAAFTSDPPWNLGVLCGDPSGGLVDVDIDDDDVRLVANRISVLPSTDVEHGHVAAPRSHRWYQATTGPIPGPRKLMGPDGPADVLVEIRGTGGQTVIPPSMHPTHGPISWEEATDGTRHSSLSSLPEPAEADYGQLVRDCHLLAILGLLLRVWPSEGGRHASYVPLAGALLVTRSGVAHPFWREHGRDVFRALAVLTGDEEARGRLADFDSTLKNIDAGRRVTGFPTLATMLGESTTEALRTLVYGLETAAGSNARGGSPAEDDEAALPGTVGATAPAALPTPTLPAPTTDDDLDDTGTLVDEYPHAPEIMRPLLRAWPADQPLPETTWSTGPSLNDEEQVAVPSIGFRDDDVPLLTPGTLSMVFGPPKAGKSWVTFALMVDVLRRGGRVLLYDWENGRYEVADRLKRMSTTPGQRDRLTFRAPGSTRLESVGDRWEPGDPGVNDLTLQIDLLRTDPQLVVVDALSNLLGRHGMSPNDAAGIERVEYLLKDVLPSTGAAVLVVDHTGHSDPDRAAGSFRKAAIVTGASFAVVPDVKMGRNLKGHSHVRLIEERSGWLQQHADDNSHIARIDVDDTSPGETTHVVLGPPTAASNLVVPVSGAAAESVEDKPEALTNHEIDDLIYDAVADHSPRGISPHGIETLLINAKHRGVTRARLRDRLEVFLDEQVDYVEAMPNPSGRGQVWREREQE